MSEVAYIFICSLHWAIVVLCLYKEHDMNAEWEGCICLSLSVFTCFVSKIAENILMEVSIGSVREKLLDELV